MARKIPGTHGFLHLTVCNACGLRRDKSSPEQLAELAGHVRECQPELFAEEDA